MSFLPIPFHSLIDITMKILDTRDPYTFIHSWRVAGMSEKMGRMGVSRRIVRQSYTSGEQNYFSCRFF